MIRLQPSFGVSIAASFPKCVSSNSSDGLTCDARVDASKWSG